MPNALSRRFWETRASALAWRINIAAWLGRAGPASFFVASAFAVVFYAMRRAQLPVVSASAVLGVALLLAAVACWWRARRGFFTPADARVLIESHLRLDTRLTAASLGIGDWPARPANTTAIVRWQLGPTSGWFGGALALVAMSLLAPLPRDAAVSPSAGAPPALLQSEDMLAALKQMNVADPQALEQLSERARELASRPAEEHYSHSALEAADALRNQIAVSAAGLGRGLDSASNAMRSANGPDMKGAAGRLAAALSGLRDGSMPANQDLLSHLPASESDLKGLTSEQRDALAQQFAEAGAQLSGIAGAAGANATVASPNTGEGDGSGIAPGGEGGGGDHAPLGLTQKLSDVGDGKFEALGAEALKRMALGDKLGTSVGAHDTDPNAAAGPGSAGAVSGSAAGGETVWINRLTPSERTALKNFFK